MPLHKKTSPNTPLPKKTTKRIQFSFVLKLTLIRVLLNDGFDDLGPVAHYFPEMNVRLFLPEVVQRPRVQFHRVVEVRRVDRNVFLKVLRLQDLGYLEVEGVLVAVLADLGRELLVALRRGRRHDDHQGSSPFQEVLGFQAIFQGGEMVRP